MLWRGKKLCDLTTHEFLEAVEQNNRLADVCERPATGQNVRDEYLRKAKALAEEGERRCPGMVQIATLINETAGEA